VQLGKLTENGASRQSKSAMNPMNNATGLRRGACKAFPRNAKYAVQLTVHKRREGKLALKQPPFCGALFWLRVKNGRNGFQRRPESHDNGEPYDLVELKANSHEVDDDA